MGYAAPQTYPADAFQSCNSQGESAPQSAALALAVTGTSSLAAAIQAYGGYLVSTLHSGHSAKLT